MLNISLSIASIEMPANENNKYAFIGAVTTTPSMHFVKLNKFSRPDSEDGPLLFRRSHRSILLRFILVL